MLLGRRLSDDKLNFLHECDQLWRVIFSHDAQGIIYNVVDPTPLQRYHSFVLKFSQRSQLLKFGAN